ncbi:MAG: hypothetical protein KGL59_11225 [Acidobacteriota bacterium]|nr:hypothetical protein [Acidobacteriota bacterium]
MSQGFWKNHQSDWTLTSLTLGTSTYTPKQAETFLKSSVQGDASLILARQLVAALLNNAAGATEPSIVSAAIAAADVDLGAGPIPENISPSTALGSDMVEQGLILDNYNNGLLPGSCAPPPPPPGSCTASSSLSVMVQGSNVTAYVPKGAWDYSATGISVVNVEGASITPASLSTPNIVNSCASDPKTGLTVCSANNSDVYILSGTTLSSTLTSGGSGYICFSGGCATNTGVAMDSTHGKALIGESLSGVPGFQLLDLGTLTFEPPYSSPATYISEDPLIDPTRNAAGLDSATGNAAGALLLSASENSNYEIADLTNSTSPAFYEHLVIPSGTLDSSGEDCQTGIALAPEEFSGPSIVEIADLTQASYTPGTPGSWTVPAGAEQQQSLSESFLAAGASGIAVAQGTHKGVVTGEFGGSYITAIALPTASGSGTPAITDWVTCSISSSFSEGLDPHTVTAYQSPASGDAVALVANGGASSVAVIDLTRMLDTSLVPRDAGGHACLSGTLPSTAVSFVSVP